MEVRIGPKAARSELPVGHVSATTYEQIEKADCGQLGKQVVEFNVRLTKPNKYGDAYYQKAYVLNGHCRFKRYGLLDVLKYKIARLFR